MIWAFKMFFKLIWKIFEIVFTVAITLIVLPFYLIYLLFGGKPSEVKSDNKPISQSVAFFPTPLCDKNMTAYEYEVYCAKRLSKEGYKKLRVTQQGHDFGADVVGYDRKGNKVCFQCKRYKVPVGISAVQEVLGALPYYKADKAVVITTSTFTSSARELAKRGNVQLIEHYYDKHLKDLSWIDDVEVYQATME